MKVVLLTVEELRALINESVDTALTAYIKKQAAEIKPAQSVTLLTYGDVMKRLGVSRATVRSYMDKNRLPFKRVGRKIYFSESDLSIVLTAGGSGK